MVQEAMNSLGTNWLPTSEAGYGLGLVLNQQDVEWVQVVVANGDHGEHWIVV